jgi:hypothetical protein
MNTQTSWLPIDVDDITLAFPANVVQKYMPPMKDIPKEFHMMSKNKWNDFIADWFFNGVKNIKLTPKTGIDETKAMRHIKTIMGSFEPQHEHKEAACAYLMSLWFDDVHYDKAK